MKNLTLDDIAKLAGISRATASRAINDRPDVSPAVRQRVREILQETGFQPNAAAHSLASQRSDMVGLVIARSVRGIFSDPYFPRLAEGIAQSCNQHHHTFSLFVEYELETLFRRITRRGFLCGAIVQAEGLDNPLIPMLVRQSHPPVVVVGRPPAEAHVSYLDVDNVGGAHQAVTHLIKLGHRRIGTLTGPMISGSGQDRLAGYRRALSEYGIEVDDALIVEGDYTEEGGYHLTGQIMAQKPSGLFIGSDSMARGVLRALSEMGLSVPQDIAIVSFDDLPPATVASPLLTTVRQPVKRIGMLAVETLLDMIKNGTEPIRTTILPTELVIRESCGAKTITNS
jgi:LacI family transcriptional regulator, galactose operon repressor